jgi:hypothetical protein
LSRLDWGKIIDQAGKNRILIGLIFLMEEKIRNNVRHHGIAIRYIFEEFFMESGESA